MKPILCLTGPTAVGKSKLALQIAKLLNTRLISADSMQIYKGLDVGTAKPSIAEQKSVKHEMIDILLPNQSYSSFLYKQDVNKILDTMTDEIPFVVGGTAFYIDSVLYKLDYNYNQDSEKTREELWAYYNKHGADSLHKLLEDIDSASSERIHKNNVKRVIRALEIAKNGQIMSEGYGNREKEHDFVLFALNLPREKLYERIEQRVDEMIRDGLIDEVRTVYDKYKDKNLQSMQAIGYKEVITYLDGGATLNETIELIKKNSRNYAKRQITYLKRMNPIWLDAEVDIDSLCAEITENYEKYSRIEKSI